MHQRTGLGMKYGYKAKRCLSWKIASEIFVNREDGRSSGFGLSR